VLPPDLQYECAGMVELADTLALGASAERHAGSSPVPRTTFVSRYTLRPLKIPSKKLFNNSQNSGINSTRLSLRSGRLLSVSLLGEAGAYDFRNRTPFCFFHLKPEQGRDGGSHIEI
jgi:hypothetical protein